MIVFENNVRTDYKLNQERKERRAAQVVLAVAIFLSMAAWSAAYLLDGVNKRTASTIVAYELCADCHINRGR